MKQIKAPINYDWNDHRHARFADVSDIVSRCLMLELPDHTDPNGEVAIIKAKIKAHGENFTTTLLEYIRARYASGHSMRYTILKAVLKLLGINKPGNIV